MSAKPGPTRVVVDRDPRAGHSRPRVLQPGTFLAPRPMLTAADGTLRVALLGIRATLCAGDELELRVEVEPGAALELVDPNGTVAYNARGGAASWRADLELGAGARVRWREQPFVVSEGADVHRETHARIAAGAHLLWRETLVLGRAGEEGGALRSVTRAWHDGAELLVEDADLRAPAERDLPGVLGGGRVLGQVALLGRRPSGEPEPERLDLAGPGAVVRALGDASHVVDRRLEPVWRNWLSAASVTPIASRPRSDRATRSS